jgi:SSS family solute:Na+ symporter
VLLNEWSSTVLRLNLGWLDYVLVAIYFVFVIGIGFIARSQISSSLDFFLSGRRLPAWVTGLAFISANLGAVEIMGMAANGAQVGLSTMHYYWIGAVPAMLFLGVVMMPFYYGSKVRSSCADDSAPARTSSMRSASRLPRC